MEAVESLLQLGEDVEMDVETYASGNPQQGLEDEASDLDVGDGEEEIMDIDEELASSAADESEDEDEDEDAPTGSEILVKCSG